MFKLNKFSKKRILLLIALSFAAYYYSLNNADDKNSQIKTSQDFLNLIDKTLKKPEVRAFLDTISYAEGTYNIKGYNTLFGGHIFKSYADHPRIIICSKAYCSLKRNKNRLYSTAAGRYQILERIWDQIAQKLDLKNFEPINQDRAVVYLIRQNGFLKYILDGNFELAAKKLHKIYPAFPGLKYNQPAKDIKELKRFYEKQLNFYKSKYLN